MSLIRRKAYISCVKCLERQKSTDRKALLGKFKVTKATIKQQILELPESALGPRKEGESWLLSLGLIPKEHLSSWYDKVVVEEMQEAAANRADAKSRKLKAKAEAARKPAAVPMHTPQTSAPAPDLPVAPPVPESAPTSIYFDPVPSTSGISQGVSDAKKAKGPPPTAAAVYHGLSDDDMSMAVNASEVAGITGSLQEDGTYTAPVGFLNPTLRRAAENALRAAVFNKYITALKDMLGSENRYTLAALSVDQLIVRTSTMKNGVKVQWSVDHISGLSAGFQRLLDCLRSGVYLSDQRSTQKASPSSACSRGTSLAFRRRLSSSSN